MKCTFGRKTVILLFELRLGAYKGQRTLFILGSLESAQRTSY